LVVSGSVAGRHLKHLGLKFNFPALSFLFVLEIEQFRHHVGIESGLRRSFSDKKPNFFQSEAKHSNGEPSH
jgi:hypothetical protein